MLKLARPEQDADLRPIAGSTAYDDPTEVINVAEQERSLDQAYAADALVRVRRWATWGDAVEAPDQEDWKALERVGLTAERVRELVGLTAEQTADRQAAQEKNDPENRQVRNERRSDAALDRGSDAAPSQGTADERHAHPQDRRLDEERQKANLGAVRAALQQHATGRGHPGGKDRGVGHER